MTTFLHFKKRYVAAALCLFSVIVLAAILFVAYRITFAVPGGGCGTQSVAYATFSSSGNIGTWNVTMNCGGLIKITWGDGSLTEKYTIATGAQKSYSHTYSPGSYQTTLTDDVEAYTGTIIVNGPPGGSPCSSSSTQCNDCVDQGNDLKCDYKSQCVVSGILLPQAPNCSSDRDNDELGGSTTKYPTIAVRTDWADIQHPTNLAFWIEITSGSNKGRHIEITWGDLSPQVVAGGYKYVWTYTAGALFGDGDYTISHYNQTGLKVTVWCNISNCTSSHDTTEYYDSVSSKNLSWNLNYAADVRVDLRCSTDGSAGTNGPCSVASNAKAYLTWTSSGTSGATPCTVSGTPWDTSGGTQRAATQVTPGERTVPITSTTAGIATITCTGTDPNTGLPGSGSDTVEIDRINSPPIASNVAVTIPNYCTVGRANLGGQTISWDYNDPDGDPQSSFKINIYNCTGTTSRGSCVWRDRTPLYLQNIISGSQTSYPLRDDTFTDILPDRTTTTGDYSVTVRVYDSSGGNTLTGQSLCFGSPTDCYTPCTRVSAGGASCFELPRGAYPYPVISSTPAPPIIFPSAPGTVDYNGTNNTYSFCSQYVTCNASGFLWDYGNGTTISGTKNPAPYTYVSNGTYNSSLKITDSRGIACTTFLPVQVGPTPSPSSTPTPTPTPKLLPEWKEVQPK